jgi:hypothetical protein
MGIYDVALSNSHDCRWELGNVGHLLGDGI